MCWTLQTRTFFSVYKLPVSSRSKLAWKTPNAGDWTPIASILTQQLTHLIEDSMVLLSIFYSLGWARGHCWISSRV